MARWGERDPWEGEREQGWRGREERGGGWRTEDTWRGDGWRERDDREREEWRREGRFGGLGREPGGRAEWDRLHGRGGPGDRYGAGYEGRGGPGDRYGAGYEGRGGPGDRYGAGYEDEGEREVGGWRRSTQHERSGEGPGSWGPGGRGGAHGRDYGATAGGAGGRYGEGAGRLGARSDLRRDEYGRDERGWDERRWEEPGRHGQGRREPGGAPAPYGHGEWRGRSEWERGGEEPGPMERLGERMREGWRRMTGRGPKGYRRSDERIREDVCERIARSDLDADEVEVKVEGGEVTFTGQVRSRRDKRALEDLADDVFGVEEVHNHLRLRRESEERTGEGRSGLGSELGSSEPH